MKKHGGRPHWAKVPENREFPLGKELWDQGTTPPLPPIPSHIRLLPEGAGCFRILEFSRFSSGVWSSRDFLGGFPARREFPPGYFPQAHSCTRKELEKMYPAFPEFCAIRERLDPTGIFLNAYLEKVFY